MSKLTKKDKAIANRLKNKNKFSKFEKYFLPKFNDFKYMPLSVRTKELKELLSYCCKVHKVSRCEICPHINSKENCPCLRLLGLVKTPTLEELEEIRLIREDMKRKFKRNFADAEEERINDAIERWKKRK